MWDFIKIIIFIMLIIILTTHWNDVAAFFNNIIDWVVYYMKLASVGPPEIPTP